jgi:hypothetical protein
MIPVDPVAAPPAAAVVVNNYYCNHGCNYVGLASNASPAANPPPPAANPPPPDTTATAAPTTPPHASKAPARPKESKSPAPEKASSGIDGEYCVAMATGRLQSHPGVRYRPGQSCVRDNGPADGLFWERKKPLLPM